MKRFVLVFLLLFLCSSCKVKRHAIEHHEESGSFVSTEVMDSSSVFSSNATDSLWYDVVKNDSFNAHIIVYDTSAPVDESTGKHPVKMEADISSSSASSCAGGSVTQSSSESSTRANSAASTDYQYSVEDESEIETSSSTPFPWVDVLAFVVVACIFCAFKNKIMS